MPLFSNTLSDDDSMSDNDELNESENGFDESGDLNDSFANNFHDSSPNTPSFSLANTPLHKTPSLRQINSPFPHINLHFSPQVQQTPIPEKNWQAVTPKTPNNVTKTPEISTMPTPDFSLIESDEFSRRRITRSASNPQIPETPCKRTVARSRLGQVEKDENVANNAQKTTTNVDEASHYENKFDQFQLIGKGSFSQVFKARNMETNQWFAIKVSNRPMINAKQRNKAIREIHTVAKLNHPHVLSYIFSWEDVLNKTMHIQMELCEKGSLSGFMSKWLEQHILNSSNYMPEEHLWILLTDMVLGLYHIHSHNLIHLDIKPANIFIGNHNDYLKIGDFGQAIDDGDDEFTEGDSRYLAPEILNPGVVKKESDIFSLGATVLEMASLIEMPQVGKTWDTLRSGNIASLGIIPMHYSNDFKWLIQLMMDPNYENRPSAEKILTHPRIQEIIQRRRVTDPVYFEALTKSVPSQSANQIAVKPPPKAPLLGLNRRNLLSRLDS